MLLLCVHLWHLLLRTSYVPKSYIDYSGVLIIWFVCSFRGSCYFTEFIFCWSSIHFDLPICRNWLLGLMFLINIFLVGIMTIRKEHFQKCWVFCNGIPVKCIEFVTEFVFASFSMEVWLYCVLCVKYVYCLVLAVLFALIRFNSYHISFLKFSYNDGLGKILHCNCGWLFVLWNYGVICAITPNTRYSKFSKLCRYLWGVSCKFLTGCRWYLLCAPRLFQQHSLCNTMVLFWMLWAFLESSRRFPYFRSSNWSQMSQHSWLRLHFLLQG